MDPTSKIVILEDDIFFGNLLKRFLMNQEYKNIELFHEEEDCIKSISKESTVVILDHHLKSSTGLEVMKEIKKINPEAHIIYLSGQEFTHIAVKAMRTGAVDYVEKNSDAFLQLKKIIDRILFGGKDYSKSYCVN